MLGSDKVGAPGGQHSFGAFPSSLRVQILIPQGSGEQKEETKERKGGREEKKTGKGVRGKQPSP